MNPFSTALTNSQGHAVFSKGRLAYFHKMVGKVYRQGMWNCIWKNNKCRSYSWHNPCCIWFQLFRMDCNVFSLCESIPPPPLNFIKLSIFDKLFFIAPPSLTSLLLCHQPAYNVSAFLPYQTLKFILATVLRPLLSHFCSCLNLQDYIVFTCCHIRFSVDLEMGLMHSNLCFLTAFDHSDVFSNKFIII